MFFYNILAVRGERMRPFLGGLKNAENENLGCRLSNIAQGVVEIETASLSHSLRTGFVCCAGCNDFMKACLRIKTRWLRGKKGVNFGVFFILTRRPRFNTMVFKV